MGCHSSGTVMVHYSGHTYAANTLDRVISPASSFLSVCMLYPSPTPIKTLHDADTDSEAGCLQNVPTLDSWMPLCEKILDHHDVLERRTQQRSVCSPSMATVLTDQFPQLVPGLRYFSSVMVQ